MGTIFLWITVGVFFSLLLMAYKPFGKSSDSAGSQNHEAHA